MTDAPYRCAIYFAPDPSGEWGRFGSTWLGRCAADGLPRVPFEVRSAGAPELERMTAAPRRYGFHATLKPPFRLVDGKDRESLVQALHAEFETVEAFDLPPVEPRCLGDFIALVPAEGHPRNEDVAVIAARCVTVFDAWRAPPTEAEIARRAVDPADARASELMLRWGYPSVLDRFRFHLSLTGALDAGQVARSGPLLEDIARLLPVVPLRFDAVCLFEEAQPGHPLRLVERIGFRP